MKTNKELATLLKEGMENGDIDMIHFVIGELEKENSENCGDLSDAISEVETVCEGCDNGTDQRCGECDLDPTYFECRKCGLGYTLSAGRIAKDSPDKDSFICEICTDTEGE